MHDPQIDDVVLLGELARAARVSRQTAWIWARSGEIPVQWRGGRYEVRRVDLASVLRERRDAETARRTRRAACPSSTSGVGQGVGIDK